MLHRMVAMICESNKQENVNSKNAWIQNEEGVEIFGGRRRSMMFGKEQICAIDACSQLIPVMLSFATWFTNSELKSFWTINWNRECSSWLINQLDWLTLLRCVISELGFGCQCSWWATQVVYNRIQVWILLFFFLACISYLWIYLVAIGFVKKNWFLSSNCLLVAFALARTLHQVNS